MAEGIGLPSLRAGALDTALHRARGALDQAIQLYAAPAGKTISTPIAREKLAKAMLKGRRRRAEIIQDVDFGEPAWDMLLELYVSRCEGRAPGVVDVCVAGDVPLTTALRWVAKLEATGHIDRQDHPRDRRRYTLQISDVAFEAVGRRLHQMVGVLG